MLRSLLSFLCLAILPTLASAEPWRAVDQPELKQALESAPVLKTESLGEPARGVNVWERWMVPNPDGKSWDVLQLYFKEYRGPTWLYACDLGTGQVKRHRLPDDHQFYLSGRALGLDGKYYIATPYYRTWSMDLFVYDPATNTVEQRGEIVPGLGGEVRPLALGPDGRIYGTGTRGNRVGLYIYDPKLRKVVKDFGPVGPTHPNGAWSRYVMGVDDTHAYIASGMIPAWYLVAVNLQTGEEKVLLESPTERVMDIVESFPGAWAIVPQEQGAPRKEYWLYHGRAIPKTGDTPPWPPKASPWEKAAKSKPQVYFDQIDPDADGNATLWFRTPEDAAKAKSRQTAGRGNAAKTSPEQRGWKAIHLTGVETYPHRLNPLSLLPDGRLYGTGDDYVGSFLVDPRSGQTAYCGPRAGLAPYTTIVCGGKLYLSGYSGGHLFVYDPARDWTLGKGGPPGDPAPDQADARSNPRYLGDFDRTTRVGLMHSSALGADGKLYFGGFGLRHYTGGGFGWYDPKTRKMDGFWKPLSGYAVHWIAPALGGRLIAISTARAADELNNNQAPPEAKLFVYDVAQAKIVREIVPIAKARTTGLIAEIAPGRLLGLTTEREHADRSFLYGVDVSTGEVLLRKALPWPVSTDPYWPHWVDPSYQYEHLTLGPDGLVWAYLKDVLVRIDPKDARVHVVGKLSPVGHPTFVGRDIYLSGPEQLRRVRNIVLAPNQAAFPGKDWATARPQSQGVEPARLEAAVKYLAAALKEYGGAETLFIVRNGRAIWAGPECDRQYQIFSATKSFTSTVLGLLIDDGKVTLGTLAKDLEPALAEHYPAVTLRHFATMTSGYDSVGGSYEFDDRKRGDSWNPGPPAPPLFAPGSKFRYWDDAMSQFGSLLTKAAGEPLDGLFKRRIADPIGMTGWRWTENDSPAGRVLSWTGGIHISSRELARFGHLFVNRGNWNGRQLVSASWVDQATSVQVPASVPNDDLPRSRGAGVYGYNWWVNGVKPNGQRLWPGAPPRTYYANGLHNNVCIVVPEWNMVIARTNGPKKGGGTNTPSNVDEIWSGFFARLAEAVGD